MTKLKNKLALITGATGGIGSALAKRFAQEGADLILVGRSTEALERLDDELAEFDVSVTLVPLDLQEFEKIEALGQQIQERFGKLDILVGNAGVLGDLTPTSHLKPKIWQKVMDINVTANWYLIRAFESLLKQSEAGRAYFVTSGITHHTRPYWGAYATSKVALERLVQTWAAELESTNPTLKINLMDPGVVRTKMRAKAMPGEDPETLKDPEDIMDPFVYLASDACTEHGQIIRAQS